MPDTITTAIIFAGKLSSLFNSCQHFDITIEAGPISISAHLAILSLHTPFFTSALSSTSGFAESADRIVRFPEHPAHAIYRLIRYCYSGSYPGSSIPELEATDPDETGPIKHFFVYVLADYVGAEELMVLATDNLREDLRLLKGLQEMGVLVSAVYGNTNAGRDDAIRNVVIDAVLQRILDGQDPGLLRDAMEQHGEFAAELMIRYDKRAREMESNAKAEFETKRKMASDAKAELETMRRMASDAKAELETMRRMASDAKAELETMKRMASDAKAELKTVKKRSTRVELDLAEIRRQVQSLKTRFMTHNSFGVPVIESLRSFEECLQTIKHAEETI